MFSQILDLADKLDIIQTVKAKLCASPIPPDLRGEYLQRVAGLLRGREFGDGGCKGDHLGHVTARCGVNDIPDSRCSRDCVRCPARPWGELQARQQQRREAAQRRRQTSERLHGQRGQDVTAGQPRIDPS